MFVRPDTKRSINFELFMQPVGGKTTIKIIKFHTFDWTAILTVNLGGTDIPWTDTSQIEFSCPAFVSRLRREDGLGLRFPWSNAGSELSLRLWHCWSLSHGAEILRGFSRRFEHPGFCPGLCYTFRSHPSICQVRKYGISRQSLHAEILSHGTWHQIQDMPDGEQIPHFCREWIWTKLSTGTSLENIQQFPNVSRVVF